MTTDQAAAAAETAAERKRKRLEAWRRRQQAAKAAKEQKEKEQKEGEGVVGTAAAAVAPPAPPPPPPPPPPKAPPVKMSLGGSMTINVKRRKRKKDNSKKKEMKVESSGAPAEKGREEEQASRKVREQTIAKINPFGEDEDADDEGEGGGGGPTVGLIDDLDDSDHERGRLGRAEKKPVDDSSSSPPQQQQQQTSPSRKRRRFTDKPPSAEDDEKDRGTTTTATTTADGKKSSRWDAGDDAKKDSTSSPPPVPGDGASPAAEDDGVEDALDLFMDKLEAGAEAQDLVISSSSSGAAREGGMGIGVKKTTTTTKAIPAGTTETAVSSSVKTTTVSIDLGGSMQVPPFVRASKAAAAAAKGGGNSTMFTHSDWESDAPLTPKPAGVPSESEAGTDDDEEGQTGRTLPPNAAGSVSAPSSSTVELEQPTLGIGTNRPAQLASEVKSEKHRREERIRELEEEARTARRSAESAPSLGRMYNDAEDGVMEEAERALGVLTAAPDALEVLAELNKKKELKAVDHKNVEYLDVKKNLYLVPRSLASLTSDDVADRRAKLGVKVRGVGCPAPVSEFGECGFTERILVTLRRMKIHRPFPVQAQCLTAVMAGRDVIGIAKTGSGKTLAYLLPMLRHILAQPDLAPHESGPVGLVLAPARELATQIHHVCRSFCRNLGLKSTAVYGGGGVAEQIGDLKRGVHVAVATPGRMIDILTMQSGKILSLRRVSYVVMDEADRMFDMGFAPQISAILSAVRPDRQTVLFSATFPRAVENLARKSLRYPIEVIVGGRSVASDTVTQHGEVVEEGEKFLRLLQLLGEHVDEESNNKVLVFVDTQARADTVFEQLVRCGYPCLSLHGGKEQEDRDSTISDFKRPDGPAVLVATSVAGRGLDVPSCGCVINYSSPNHLEDLVHRVGRTGRAGNRGVAYTFVDPTDEAKFAPIVVRAMSEAGQAENITPELRALSDAYKEKVKKGEARYAGSGFKGKGYTYDASELTDAQKLARMEKRQALLDAGLIDPDEEDPLLRDAAASEEVGDGGGEPGGATADAAAERKEGSGGAQSVDLPIKISADLLALPGMHEAIMKKSGMAEPTTTAANASGGSHFVEEIEINDYPREARWKVTQKETTSRLQDEFETAVTLKGEYFDSKRTPAEGERKLYLHLEAQSEQILKNCVHEVKRLLNEETLRVGARAMGGGSHRYNVLS